MDSQQRFGSPILLNGGRARRSLRRVNMNARLRRASLNSNRAFGAKARRAEGYLTGPKG